MNKVPFIKNKKFMFNVISKKKKKNTVYSTLTVKHHLLQFTIYYLLYLSVYTSLTYTVPYILYHSRKRRRTGGRERGSKQVK